MYELRKVKTADKPDGSGKYESFALAVPPVVGRMLEGKFRFNFELTSEGLLYRPVKKSADEFPVPNWMGEA